MTWHNRQFQGFRRVFFGLVVLVGSAHAQAPLHVPPVPLVDYLGLRANLTVEPAKGTVEGRVRHHFKAISANTTSVFLHAGADIQILKITGPAGERRKYTHKGDGLTVSIPRIQKGEASQVEVTYSARPRDGLHFVTATLKNGPTPEVWTQGETVFNRHWIPLWDYPNERFKSEMWVNVPAEYRVIGNGKLLSELVEQGRRRVKYKMDRNHVGYLISLNIGQFDLSVDAGAKPTLWYAVYPEDKPHLKRGLGDTRHILKVLGQLFGMDYPYGKYSQTVASHYPLGGMENVTATTLKRSRAIYDESAAMVHDVTGLVVHEAVHQWFGDVVTCRDFAHIWLNEGFATYFTAVYRQLEDGQDRFLESMDGLRRWHFAKSKKRPRPVVTYKFKRAGTLFNSHIYGKGAWVLHMLERRLGRTVFLKGVRHYLKKFEDGVAVTADLRKVMEEVSGQTLEGFFKQWLFRAGHPVLRVSVKAPVKGKSVVEITQKTAQPFAFPLVARVVSSSGAFVDHRLPIKTLKESHKIAVPEDIIGIEIDPNGDLLKELVVSAPTDWLKHQVRSGTTILAQSQAIEDLTLISQGGAFPSVIADVLRDARVSRPVKKAAANALGTIGGEDACRALLASTTQPDARVRVALVDALGNCEDKTAASYLNKAATIDPSIHVVASALSSLGRMDSEATRRLLVRNLKRTSWDEVVARGALAGIGQVGGDWAKKIVLRLIDDAKSPWRLRRAAVTALGGFVGQKSADRKSMMRKIRLLVLHTDEFMAARAIALLVKHGDSNDLPLFDKAIGRLPQKWHHKKSEDWRTVLAGKSSAGSRDKNSKTPKKKN